VLTDLRRSSNGQDATPSSAETAVRSRPRRSIVRSLNVEAMAPGKVAPLVVAHHYLHSMPPAAVATFGVMHDDNLCGAVVVTAGSRHAHRLLDGAGHDAVATVARLWLADALPKNSESRVLAIVGRLLRQRGEVRALVSYADPAAGHIGTIYQAAGWSYLGQSDVGRYLDLGDGALHHPRSVYTLHGTNSPRVLRTMGIPARSVLVAGKHRYCQILDPAWAWRLRAPVLPFPARPVPAESAP
jgi:hypothetical protein